MRKRKPRTSNPLINESPADTLNYCAAVVNFVQSAEYLRGCAKSGADYESFEFGKYLTLQAVQDALLFEATRVTVEEKPIKPRRRDVRGPPILAVVDTKH